MKKIFKCILNSGFKSEYKDKIYEQNEYIISDDLFLIELYLAQRKISLPYKILELSKKEVKKSFKVYNKYNDNWLNYRFGYSITNKELEYFDYQYTEDIDKYTKKKKFKKNSNRIIELIYQNIIETNIVDEFNYNMSEYKYYMDKD